MQKPITLFISFLILYCGAYAQTPKKQEKEKAPTQKEMQDMMKEAQAMMDGLDPETKKSNG